MDGSQTDWPNPELIATLERQRDLVQDAINWLVASVDEDKRRWVVADAQGLVRPSRDLDHLRYPEYREVVVALNNLSHQLQLIDWQLFINRPHVVEAGRGTHA